MSNFSGLIFSYFINRFLSPVTHFSLNILADRATCVTELKIYFIVSGVDVA